MTSLLAKAKADRPSGHCHELVAETAKSFAHEAYDALMTDSPDVWAEWRRRHPGMCRKALERRFVAKYWSAYIPAARATLAQLLAGSTDPALKDRVHEALVLDASLVRGRAQVETTQ